MAVRGARHQHDAGSMELTLAPARRFRRRPTCGAVYSYDPLAGIVHAVTSEEGGHLFIFALQAGNPRPALALLAGLFLRLPVPGSAP